MTFANASADAEADKGALRIQRWSAGKADAAELRLPVLGSYSATAPYDCAK